MRFNEFLVKAKLACYANEKKTNKKILKDGARELSFQENIFRYRDVYYGSNPFFGGEIVWKNDQIFWHMNYHGKILSNAVSEKEVFKFLRSSMRQVKEEEPFRGPANFKSENFEYTNKIFGKINSFTGVERILYRGCEIYTADYSGGLI